MTDSRFERPQERGKDCLNCKHHTFHEGVACNHPQRPDRPSPVIRWAAGCPQHEPLKDPA